MHDPLFEPLAVGDLRLPNRVLMSPLTRSRAAQPGNVPRTLNATYYAQRASAGLIVSEATQVTPRGQGYAYTPGLHSDAQEAGWREVCQAVHAAGGRILAQLWHVGRVSHASLHGGEPPVSNTTEPYAGQVYIEGMEYVNASPPRVLETDEIPAIVDAYKAAAERAKRAGFDGVELHGANGYLPQQFLSDATNLRADRYGGSIQNRIRFVVEVLEAITEVWGGGRVGMRVSPGLGVHGATESDPVPLYAALVEEANRLELAFLDVVEFYGKPRDRPSDLNEVQRTIRDAFHGAYCANGAYSPDIAAQAVASGRCDAVLFGKAFLANPDLPERIRRGAELQYWDRERFYGGGAEGYTDYPRLEAR
jgi:N-ethylmaleimide reductase